MKSNADIIISVENIKMLKDSGMSNEQIKENMISIVYVGLDKIMRVLDEDNS